MADRNSRVDTNINADTLKIMTSFGLMPLRSRLRTLLGYGLFFAISSLASIAGGEPEENEKQPAHTSPEVEPAVTTGPLIKLEPYVANESPPKLCFGVSLTVIGNVNTGKVMSIYINRVKEKSDALVAGFGPRTRIYRIDGIPVEEMSSSFNDGSELNQLFINRKLGDKIVVEAVPESSKESKTVTLMERVNLGVDFRVIDVQKPAPTP
uniref:hypothetical protein n=2 Tax=Cephaloticoccus sp. TaxID=1985742 RepID=UPI00404B054D